MRFPFFLCAVLIGNTVFADEPDVQSHTQMHHHMREASSGNASAMSGMSGMNGALGSYPATREASGTSWQPDSSPHEGIHRTSGEWMLMTHGYADLIYDRQSGPRGDDKTFGAGMLMLMGQRRAGAATLGLRGMFSFDPLMGKSGYPELFQTGETADGKNPLIDRQHPHDLVMELAATWSLPLSSDSSVFGYAGLPGEPALGPSAFMHRFSGMENPEAPISHHWLDSTHITYGVATLGYVYRNWKLEGSLFRGREPDPFRYGIETGRLDSHSVRLTFNPTPNWSTQISRGHIVSPEILEPDVDVDRTTTSVTSNFPFGAGSWQTTFAWGRNVPSQGESSKAWLLESALGHDNNTFFGRIERVGKNELFASSNPLAEQIFEVNKFTVGYVRDVASFGHYGLGIGGSLAAHAIPDELKQSYGRRPLSGMVFMRIKLTGDAAR